MDLFGEQCNGMGGKVLLAEAIIRVDKIKFVEIINLWIIEFITDCGIMIAEYWLMVLFQILRHSIF